ncbi:MAG: choice-of-anchor tandem repeat GloVer-containing protein [Candidatus Sulfotelmatobacter sp.]
MADERQDSATILGTTLRASSAFLFGIAILAPTLAVPLAQAQTLTVLHNFSGASDGAQPPSGLTMDSAGDLYGVAISGGMGYGVVYKMTHGVGGWRMTTLYRFRGGYDGAYPVAAPVFGPDGALYGTTSGGGEGCGSYGCGTVYRLAAPASSCKTALCEWTETGLYRAVTDNGEELDGQVLFDRAGNIYSTVGLGGESDGGYVFELTPSGQRWTRQILYSFKPRQGDCNDPHAGLVFDSSGNLYGTADTGCPLISGGVFELTPSAQGWTESILRSFNDRTDGYGSYAPLTPDGQGNFYGTTFDLGPQGGGTIFELTPSGQGWAFSIVWTFNEYDDNGANPYDPVSLDAAGNLYGTTFECFGYYGTVFKLTPSNNGWAETVLYRFLDGDDGGWPESSVVMDAQGNLYGTTAEGGADDNGVVWEITP